MLRYGYTTSTTGNDVLSQMSPQRLASTHNYLSKLEAHHEGAVQAAAGSGTSSQKVSLEPVDNRGDLDGPRLSAAAGAPQMVSSIALSPLRCTCSH